MDTEKISNEVEERFGLQDIGRKVMVFVTAEIGVYFAWRATNLFKANGGQWPRIDGHWAGLVLGLVALQIGAAIVARIVLATLLSRLQKVDSVEDERDQLIELRSSQRSHTTMSLAFLTSLVVIWRGASLMLGFNILALGFFISGAVYYTAQLIYQRRGW